MSGRGQDVRKGGTVKKLLVLALLLGTAATAIAFDRCVVLELAYSEG